VNRGPAAAKAHVHSMSIEQRIEQFHQSYRRLREEVGKVIVGHEEIVENTLIALFAGGHVLLEGVPGLGKTLLVRTLGKALDLAFSRIQFTPDLMPADILGTNLVVEDPSGRKRFEFQKGPVFAHLVLADEINRATPKTQSALLEAMQEHSVTAGGQMRRLEEPFFVLATQNPIEQEGTYPLPEAQLDRFLFKLLVGNPNEEELIRILDRTTGTETPEAKKVLSREELLEMQRLAREVPIAAHVKRHIARLIQATHPGSPTAPESVNRFVRFGSSPRGAQALTLGGKVRALARGRLNVSFDDVAALAPAALRHRILRNFEAEAEGVDADRILADVLAAVSREPAAEAA